MTEQLHAIIADHAGDAEVLQWQETTLPELGADQLRVETAAVGLNFIDVYQRSGVYPMQFPMVPGSEVSGTVVEVGADVTDFEIGDHIMTSSAIGAYGEQCTVRAEDAAHVPDGVDMKVAAALPMQGCTAHYLANSVSRPQEGDTVLVHAGAGGVGLLLTQLLSARGVRVITTASTEEKREKSRAAGAKNSIRYEDFAARVRELTDGEGVRVVYDGVGKATWEGSLDALGVRGMFALFGGASGQVPSFDLQRLNSGGSLFACRPSLQHFMRTPEERKWRYASLLEAVNSGVLSVEIAQEYPLRDAAEAHRALEQRETTGKTVLIP
jgi:NADPH2:quinone reductase